MAGVVKMGKKDATAARGLEAWREKDVAVATGY